MLGAGIHSEYDNIRLSCHFNEEEGTEQTDVLGDKYDEEKKGAHRHRGRGAGQM